MVTKETKKISQKDFEKKVIEYAKTGLTSEKIGQKLRKEDIHPNDFEKKISQILKENNLYVNPDLKNVDEKLNKIKTHYEKNKKDKRAMREIDKKFSVKIIKSLDEQFIRELPKDKIIIFLDLASGSLHHIKNSNLKNVFIIDHHEISEEIPGEINIINPELNNKEKAKIAILGMIGDSLENKINELKDKISNNGDIQKIRGPLIYPSTRPLNRTLEYSSNPYLPGITGNIKGVLELLREIGLNPEEGKYKSLIELNEEEMEKLIATIILKCPKSKEDIIGDIFLLKISNRLEDARELSAMINACSKFGESGTAIQTCMGIAQAKKKAEAIHVRYKQLILSGIKYAENAEKIIGKGFVIINAKEEIKDTMAGTITSILSHSRLYEEGTIITILAHYEDKIKISCRVVGKNGRNVREILNNIITIIGGEIGGHYNAAGATISQDKEEEFLKILKKNLEIEVIKIQ